MTPVVLAQFDPSQLPAFMAVLKDFGPWTFSGFLLWLWWTERDDRKDAEKEARDLAKQVVSEDTRKVLEAATAIAQQAKDLQNVRRSG